MKKILEIYKKHEEIINYLIVGVLTTIVSLVVKWGLLFTILDAKNAIELQTSIIISWFAAVTFAYITNRVFVFKSKSKNIIKEIISFFSSRVLTLLLDMGIMWFFITFLKLNSRVWVIIWTMIVQVLVTVLNYIFSKLLVFKKK
ncbi:MAG: GtrA family protein [Bacilli bacterium]|nr:GtrA family protein [Bacilli bacterium]